MRRALSTVACGSMILVVSISNSALQARQFAPKSETNPAAASSAAEGAPNDNVVQLPLYTGASDKSVKVSVVKVVYANNKDEFLPNNPNWAQFTVSFENIGKPMVSLDSVKVKQNSGVLLNSASSTIQLAKAPDAMAEVGKSTGIIAAGQFAGAFIFPPLALVSGALAMFGLGDGTKKWSKRMEAIDASALSTGAVPPQSLVNGNIYLPAVQDQKELVFLYSIDGKARQLTVPVSGYQTIELKKKKKKLKL